jgi:hypothetical protein
MIVLSFRNKREKENLLEKAKRMEEYASMIVECIEDSESYDEDYEERSYHSNEGEMMDKNDRMIGRYGYRRRMK